MSIALLKLNFLDALRGFVAVGRRMSITQAAQDLCLTQSAVSRQIQSLEQALGVPLLVREHRRVRFTPAGERLFRSADSALQQLQEVVGTLSVQTAPVTISASIGIAGLWLLPRLGGFLSQYPEIEVRISANNRLVDLQREGLDLALRYAPAEGLTAGAQRLFGERIAPVANPVLGVQRLQQPSQLANYHLLEFDGEPHAWLRWEPWLAQRGWSGYKPRAVLRFNQYDQVIQAAAAGQGIALGRLELIRPWLADQRLQCLAEAGPELHYAYWLLSAETMQLRPEVQLVKQWLLQQACSARQ